MTQAVHADRDDAIREAVRTAYRDAAEGGSSCCGGGCAPPSVAAERLGYSQEELNAIPDEADLGLGCGNPTAMAGLRPGEVVLDLGSGGGIDCFLAARQVGPEGHVIGVDMTPEMLAKARANARKAGVGNVEFRLGEIEHLPVADGTVDVILSNCVVNLSDRQDQVFREAFRVLRPGGRLHISDIVAVRPMPESMRRDPALVAGCIGNASDVAEIERLLAEAGFADISLTVDEESAAFIAEWAPGSGAEAYVRSARIEAVKPRAKTACC